MTNKLYLYHRPTEQHFLLATRGSAGWRMNRHINDIDNAFQRMVNGLEAVPTGHQDDLVLVMDDAAGAPWAVQWELMRDRVMRLPAEHRFPNARYVDASGDSLRASLHAVTGRRPEVDQPAMQRSTVQILQAENALLREGITHLIVLLELKELGEEIYTQELTSEVKHPRRSEFLQNKSMTWINARAWKEKAVTQIRQWLSLGPR